MLPFFPQDVLDEISDFIESVSEGFPAYSLEADVASSYTSAEISWQCLLSLFT